MPWNGIRAVSPSPFFFHGVGAIELVDGGHSCTSERLRSEGVGCESGTCARQPAGQQGC